MEGVRKMFLRLFVLFEFELVLEGEELWILIVLLEEGEEGRELCFLLIFFLNIGNREIRVDRFDLEFFIGILRFVL